MSKPIYLTKEYIDSMVEEFRKNVADTKMSDGKITFTKSFNYSGDNDSKAHVIFEPVAYVKMLSLLSHFDSEVAWHGIVRREGKDTFIVTDILVYPQVVTGATVNTDQEEYQKWMMTMDDDVYNSMRMQGHSHVNMNTEPSSVDTNHQQQILSQLKENDYYLFMIFNKRLEHTIKVYDYANNVMYENKDIVLNVSGAGFDRETFVASADQVVSRKTYPAAASNTCGNVYYSYENKMSEDKKRDVQTSTLQAKTLNKKAGKTKTKGKSKSKQVEDVLSSHWYNDRFYAVNDWDSEIFGGNRFDT